MQISVPEALGLIRLLSSQVHAAREAADRAAETRDAVIRELDGQPGMTRRDMAEAAGMTKSGVLQIANRAAPRRESLVDGVPMDQALYDALVDIVGGLARESLRGAEAVRVDVHA